MATVCPRRVKGSSTPIRLLSPVSSAEPTSSSAHAMRSVHSILTCRSVRDISPFRAALDTNSSLPLFNSLTHLVYLTSTSPRIREIMTMDGGLERLVRILRDFCTSPPPPENPIIFYGLQPPGTHPKPLEPTLLPKSYDKHAAYRFSLAFQCIVNIGFRGSEPARS